MPGGAGQTSATKTTATTLAPATKTAAQAAPTQNTIIGKGSPTVLFQPDPVKNPSTWYYVDPVTGKATLYSGNAIQTQTATSGGGGGGGGGGGSGSASVGTSYKEAFYNWMGRYPSSGELATMQNQAWVEDTIRRFACTNNGTGPLMLEAQNTLRQLAAPFYGGDPATIPASLVQTIISDGIYGDASYLTNTYFPALKGVGATNPLAAGFIDAWTKMTGTSLTDAALAQLNTYVKAYGFTDTATAAWDSWVKGTNEAITGNYGATQRAEISSTISVLFGRDATADELAPFTPSGAPAPTTPAPAATPAARVEIKAGSTDSATVMALKKLLNAAGWQPPLTENDPTYGPKMTAAVKWYQGQNDLPTTGIIDPTTRDKLDPLPVAPPPETTPTTPPSETAGSLWELNAEALLERLRGTQEYQDIYGEKPSWMSEQDFISSAMAYNQVMTMYYGDQVVINDDGSITIDPGDDAPSSTTASPFGAWGLNYVNPDMLITLLNSGVTPEMLSKQFTYTEDAEQMSLQYSQMIDETGFTGEIDWYTVASGGVGSGVMKAKLQQAQNLYAFKEAWMDTHLDPATGQSSLPSPEDYAALNESFVSPAQYLRRVEAINSAQAQLPQINDLLGRTLGMQVTEGDLVGIAMGSLGSGELRAMIDQATRLDAYTDTLYQYKGGGTLTPDDYAQVAGYPSADAFKWEITVTEKMAEMGDDIRATWNKVNPTNPMTDDMLKTLLGQSEGWGAIQADLTEAEELDQQQRAARNTAMNIDKISPVYQTAQQGGVKQGLAGFADIGSV